MLRARSTLIGRALPAAAAAAFLLGSSTGCSSLTWRREKKELRAELAKSPGNLALEKEYAPQNCYGATHVGILSDPEVLKALARVLDAATAKGAS